MERVEKALSISAQKADAEKDIALINQHSRKELTPEEVYCFTLDMSNNEVDRDIEQLTEKTLRELAPMFVGKPVQKDHRWGTDSTVARLYETRVIKTQEKTSVGDTYAVLRAKGYMLRTEENQPVINAIEGGIIKHVSVGFQVKHCNCSICGKPQRWSWQIGKRTCEDGHVRGETYDKKLCTGLLEDAEDAFEVSFTAVPSNRDAGVVKGLGAIEDHVAAVVEAQELSLEQLGALEKKVKSLRILEEERMEREEIMKSVEQYRSTN